MIKILKNIKTFEILLVDRILYTYKGFLVVRCVPKKETLMSTKLYAVRY